MCASVSNAKPQGDLISREALKKAITNRLVSVTYNSDYTDGLQDGYLNAIEDIDNAPTVEDDGIRAYLDKKLEDVRRWKNNYTDPSSYNVAYLEGQEALLKEIKEKFHGLLDRLDRI